MIRGGRKTLTNNCEGNSSVLSGIGFIFVKFSPLEYIIVFGFKPTKFLFC